MAGRGRPIVLVPGMLGSTYTFRKVMDRLVAAGQAALVVEPLGTGGSSRPEHADYSLTAQADRLAAVLDTLGLRSVVAVCHAVSGSICYRAAYRHPNAIGGIVSINGGPAERAGTPRLRLALRLAPLLRLLPGDARGQVRDGLRDESFDPAWVTEEVVDRYIAPFGNDTGQIIRNLRLLASAPEPEPLTPNLSAIRVPVVLLATAMKPDEVALLRSRLPGLVVRTPAGAGNYIQEEAPDVVVDAIRVIERRTSSLGGSAASPVSSLP
jgi:pimeloyl-ACP methyl ester carboxylesterase